MSEFELIQRWAGGAVAPRDTLVKALRRCADEIEAAGGDTIRSELHDPYGDGVIDLRSNRCPFDSAVGEMYVENLAKLNPSPRTIFAIESACTCSDKRHKVAR
jgi:hypothetical protein